MSAAIVILKQASCYIILAPKTPPPATLLRLVNCLSKRVELGRK